MKESAVAVCADCGGLELLESANVECRDRGDRDIGIGGVLDLTQEAVLNEEKGLAS